MLKWRAVLNRYLEGECPIEEIEELRPRGDLSAEARREIEETLRLSACLGEAFRSLPVPEGGASKAVSAIREAAAREARPQAASPDDEELAADPELEEGLSAAFKSIPFPAGGLERLLAGFRDEADAIDDSRAEEESSGREEPEGSGDVRAQFGEAGGEGPEADAEREDQMPLRRRQPRFRPPTGPFGTLPGIGDVLAASKDAGREGEEAEGEETPPDRGEEEPEAEDSA